MGEKQPGKLQRFLQERLGSTVTGVETRMSADADTPVADEDFVLFVGSPLPNEDVVGMISEHYQREADGYEVEPRQDWVALWENGMARFIISITNQATQQPERIIISCHALF